MRAPLIASLLLSLPLAALATDVPQFDQAKLRSTIQTLSSDAFGGRAPGSRGEQRTDGAGQVGGVAVDGVSGRLEVGGVGGAGPQRHEAGARRVPAAETSSRWLIIRCRASAPSRAMSV